MPVTVTITSNDTSIATVSKSATTFGQPSVTFTNVTTASVGTIYVQGQTLGTTTLTATASGYNTGTGGVTVNPSGFVINPSQGNISTTPTSSATAVTLEPAILTPGILTFAGAAELNPSIGPFNIGITSTNTAAGNITTSPVVFHGGDTSDSTTFQPAAAGTTNLVLGAQPAGFSTPTQYQQITANVVAALGASIGNTTTGSTSRPRSMSNSAPRLARLGSRSQSALPMVRAAPSSPIAPAWQAYRARTSHSTP